ncbi:hypothetical protein F4808DRAFT_434737 [Astrocystis sublimbata]|nr:hypothetical protein F4808DRAFT_434737 [Astrocystis sublimbata]
MRSLRRCSGSVGFLMLGLLAIEASANGQSDGEYEVLWIEKSIHILQHVKRKDTSVCKSESWTLCPASVGGGCCPDYFACDTASCYATTAGPTSCGGKTGYYACPATLGAGGCCPVGFMCNDQGTCNAPPGNSQSCQPNWFGCPISLGGGCCRDGWVCGSGVCYDQKPETYPVSETKTTTDSRGRTTITVVTSLAVITEGPNTSSGSPTVVEVPQLIPSTVAKMDAIQTTDSSKGGGGLSSGALGGIVAGVIVLLIAIVVAATFIVLYLKKAERAARDAEKAAESKHGSDSEGRSRKPGFGEPTISEIDTTTDVDPLHRFPIQMPSPHSRSRSNTDGTTDRTPLQTPNLSDSRTSSPPLWGTAFKYAPSVASDGRQSSLDSRMHNDAGGPRAPSRVSADSRVPYGHARNNSDTSELEGPHGVSELETEKESEESRRRSSSITRPGKTHVRRNSDQTRARGDSNAAAGTLKTVNESLELHGYYGPPHTAAGQTGACSSPTLSQQEK